jgi:hypothetical protein
MDNWTITSSSSYLTVFLSFLTSPSFQVLNSNNFPIVSVLRKKQTSVWMDMAVAQPFNKVCSWRVLVSSS